MVTVIQGWQTKKIYAIANALGFVDRTDKENDILHMIIHSQTGKTSTKDLTYREANAIIAYLEKQQNQTVQEVMSQGQKKKCWQLMYELQSLDREPNTTPVGERLAGIIERQFKVKSTPQRIFNHLSKDEGNQLIEILKNYIKTAERRFMN
ncbi:regulatory protein GemA [[Clostridium] innocuum]|nr:regulatory protein GemA [[Clostridium] innocuum]MCR0259190.1 regulatory protein GemA [[Clostridium] innocuum]